jgi:hypothetical protein
MTGSSPEAGEDALSRLDSTVAHSARVWNYLLGGKDHFAADREAAELALQAYPALAEVIRSNRAFLGRAVRFLVSAGHPAVPGHRHRPASSRQHARGGTAGGAGQPHRLRRPIGVAARVV